MWICYFTETSAQNIQNTYEGLEDGSFKCQKWKVWMISHTYGCVKFHCAPKTRWDATRTKKSTKFQRNQEITMLSSTQVYLNTCWSLSESAEKIWKSKISTTKECLNELRVCISIGNHLIFSFLQSKNHHFESFIDNFCVLYHVLEIFGKTHSLCVSFWLW